MPVRKHGHSFQARIQIGGQRFGETFATKKDAAEWERLQRSRITDHQVGRTPDYTLNEALTRWLTNEAAQLESYENLKDKVRTMLQHTENRLLADVVGAADAVKLAGIAAGLQPATINRRLAILRRVAKLAFSTWEPAWLDRDLGAKIKLLPGEQPRFVQATPVQVRALMLACPPRVAAYIEFAALTGFRRGELFQLTPAHFVGPLPPNLGAKTFPYNMGENELRQGFEAARAKTDLQHIQFRDLRRTFGSWIVQRTKSLKAAQDLLGHTSSQITSRHYAHLLQGDLREAVDTLPSLRAKRGPRKTTGRTENAA